MAIKRFEEIEAWQEARKLTQLVYKATKSSEFSKDFGLKDQIQRAAVSIMANIAEGFDRNSNNEFIRFLNYSLSSTSELKSHLYVALDQNYLSKETFDDLSSLAAKVSRMINGFLKYLTDHRQPTTDNRS